MVSVNVTYVWGSTTNIEPILNKSEIDLDCSDITVSQVILKSIKQKYC